MSRKAKNLIMLLPFLPAFRVMAQSSPGNAILAVIENHGLQTPRSRWEQKTRAEIHGTSCAATKWTDVSIDSFGQDKYTLSYNVEIDIEDDKDACLEGDVPAIDTKFDLVFEQAGSSHSIAFKGEVPNDCKKCKPKRAHAISGTLTRLNEHAYRLSFSGDLSDTVDLEPSK